MSLEIGEPRKERPRSGVVRVSVDCTMACSVSGNGWKQYDKRGEELARDLEMLYDAPAGGRRGALDSGNALHLVEGQSVWVFHIDCAVLSDDGNALDALSIACRTALADLMLPTFQILEGSEVSVTTHAALPPLRPLARSSAMAAPLLLASLAFFDALESDS